jgi:hypothetical protein
MRSSRKFYISQLLFNYDSVTSVVITLTENIGQYLWGLSVELGNIVAKNHGSDVDKGSHPILLTLTWFQDIQQDPTNL